MKQLYYTLIISSFLFLFYSCLDEPDMDGGVQNARVPEVGVTEFREKTATTLLVSSSVIKENGLPLTKRGFRCWQIDPENEEKLLGVAKDTFDTKDIEKGEYSMLIEGLKNNACYKITALAFNEMGVGYSKDTIKVYTNQGIGAVKISEIEESQVTASTAKVEGIISDKGEGEILDFGFELYLNGKKDTTFRKSDGVDWGDTDSTFSYVLTGLKQMTDYEIVAFAENSFGSFSQNGKKKFCTKDGRPVLKDTISAKADFDFVSMFAELASQGESALEEVGFCWTTERNPLRPNLEEDESIVGELTAENTFCGQINALETNVTYYARAYAKNAFGVVYSKDSIRISRKRNVPTISLKPSSSFIIEDGIVTIGGELQDEGKADSSRVTLSLYYSTDEKDLSSSSEYPTKYEGVQDINLEEDGKTFNVSLKLLGGKQYYVRAYATNASGTAASKEIETFTLQDIFVAKESFPGDGRQDFMAFSLGDNAYVLGGKVGNDYTNQLYCYGSGSKAWTQLVSYEWNIEGGSVCTDGNSAYIIGGKEAENITEVYSYAYNEWKHRPSMKLRNDMVGTLNAISFVQNGSVVVIGGEKILANDSRGLIVQDSIYYWKDGDWNHANNFPAMIKGGIAVTEGDTVIVGLGSISTDSISGNSSVNRKLWYSSGGDWNQWTALTEAPTDMGKVSTGVVKDSCLYFIDDKSVIWMYSLNDNTWYKRSKWDSGVTDKPEYKILIIGETIHLLAINNFGVSSFVTYDPTWDIANEQNGF